MIELHENWIYTSAQVCELLQISDSTLRRWVKAGKLPYAQLGKGYRFWGKDLLALFSNSAEQESINNVEQ